MFGFIKKSFFAGLTILWTLMYVNLLSCISIINKECKVRPEIINVNSDEPLFNPFSITTSKCSVSCNNINDPNPKMCVSDVLKNLNVNVLNIMLRNNETRHIELHETCNCKCRWETSICNNKQRWNDDKYRCECKELIDKGVCDKGSIWNPSNCECECDKSCDVGKYLDYENCKCRKKWSINWLIDECTENIDEVKVAEVILTENMSKCSSCILYIILFSIIFAINIGISTYFVYYKYMNRNKENVSRHDYVYQATNF